MNVTLIGMAGAGKSYIGERLAERLGLEFVDSDDLLAQAFGASIQSILEDLGEEKYIDTEAKLHMKHTRGRDNLVISPAGSIVYHEGWMDHLKDISTIVYLRVPFETIESRLKDAPPRAVIGLGRKTLKELYDERAPLYELHADFIVDAEPLDLEGVLEAIVRELPPERADRAKFATMARDE